MVLDCNGKQIDLSTPVVMGILNLTPDSFYDGGHYMDADTAVKRAGKMIGEGASILDLGAVSTRPDAKDVGEQEEMERMLPSLKAIRRTFPDIIISIDTFRVGIAGAAIDNGADVINDIYGGRYEKGMFDLVVRHNVPYILMHMKGTPETMQDNPVYRDVVAEVAYFFSQQISHLNERGFHKVIVDPGFGFGKTVTHNYTLLSRLNEFKRLGQPVLAGISRKTMIWKVLGCTPGQALNGTSVLNTVALLKGADILRVHDVKEAVEAIRLVREMNCE